MDTLTEVLDDIGTAQGLSTVLTIALQNEVTLLLANRRTPLSKERFFQLGGRRGHRVDFQLRQGCVLQWSLD